MTFGLENLFIFGNFSHFYYTSRLSSQNCEICLQKYLPISGKLLLSIANYLKRNAVGYQGHLTIENNLKVYKNVVILKQAQLSPEKNAWGTRTCIG